MANRPLYTIAREIRADWKNVYFGAAPYLLAMGNLSAISEDYVHDRARSVVEYFLCNAQTWRGDKARAIKAELKAMLR
jgi:hypothetical protein